MDKVFECLAMLPLEQKRGQLCAYPSSDVEQRAAWNRIQLEGWGTFTHRPDLGGRTWRVTNARLTAAGVKKLAEAFSAENSGKWGGLLEIMGKAEINALAAYLTPKAFAFFKSLLP